METRATYRTKNGACGAEAVKIEANKIIREGIQPRGRLIKERLGQELSQTTITQGLREFYQETGELLRQHH